jgi:hypothetical protein
MYSICNGYTVCFLLGKNSIFKYYLDEVDPLFKGSFLDSGVSGHNVLFQNDRTYILYEQCLS